VRPYISKIHDLIVNDEGDFEFFWDSLGEPLTVILPEEGVVDADAGSHASSHEVFKEPDFRRTYELRRREHIDYNEDRVSDDINENFIAAEESERIADNESIRPAPPETWNACMATASH
jgi:hypothetical protein